MASLQTHEGVRDLIAAYALACDEAQLGAWRATFLPDGVLETAEVTYRGEEIDLLMENRVVTKLRERAENRRTRHHLTTQRITLEPEGGASAWTYFQLVRNGLIEEAGIYEDRLVLDEAGQWKFAHRAVTVEFRSSLAPTPERPVPTRP